jgi:hypothetical protein
MPSATNIIAGPAELYSAVFGSTEPLDTAVSAALTAPWGSLGGTDDGVTLNVSHEWQNLRMDQIIDSAGKRKTGRTITVATNLVEGTLENLALALAETSAIQTGGTGGTAWRALEVSGDDSGAEPTYTALILRGRAPLGKRRLFVCRKVLQTEDVESAYKKDDQWLIPVTFECHWVSASIRPFRIVDEGTGV